MSAAIRCGQSLPDVRNEMALPRHTKHFVPGVAARVTGVPCVLRDHCLREQVNDGRRAELQPALCFRKRLPVGTALYRAGDPMTTLYVIQSGALISRLPGEQGADYVTGLHLPGEMLGIEGIAEGRHTRHVVAVEQSVMCGFRFPLLERITSESAAIQRWFHRQLSGGGLAAGRTLTLLRGRKADERVAGFLLGLAERFARLGGSATDFPLHLTRRDLGNHLGISSASVSRAFTRLVHARIVRICRPRIEVLDLAALSVWGRGGRHGAPGGRESAGTDANRETTALRSPVWRFSPPAPRES